ncbi:MAG: hypothetical protein WGN25_14185 [Candidatus Electrothrix sp. GW3-4]
MPPLPKDARNILIRSTNWIGDAIMTTLLNLLKKPLHQRIKNLV